MKTLPIKSALWVAQSTNTKTGNVPTLWIGRTKEETALSCAGCGLRPKKEGGSGDCYAYGTPERALRSIQKAARLNPSRYTLRSALLGSVRSAKMARLTSIGDSARLPIPYVKQSIRKIRAFGMDAVGFTHYWEDFPSLKGWLMASVDSLDGVDKALALGWRVAVTVPWDFIGDNGTGRFRTAGGARGIVCPAIKSEGAVTCNTCRLCDGSKAGPVIAFPMHGPKWSHKLRARRAKRLAERQAALDSLNGPECETCLGFGSVDSGKACPVCSAY